MPTDEIANEISATALIAPRTKLRVNVPFTMAMRTMKPVIR